MKKIFLLLLGFSLLLGNILACGGGSSASPPASIPAPVASLMTVSTPTDTGATTVTGAAGAVNGGATVLAANLTQGGSVKWWEKIFLRKAFAQAVVQTSTTADDTGAFTLMLDSNSGDTLGIRQQVGAELSDRTDLTVP